MGNETSGPRDAPPELAAASPAGSVAELLADLQALVTCESPSADLAAVARSADLVAAIGTRRLGFAPERVVLEVRAVAVSVSHDSRKLPGDGRGGERPASWNA